MLKIVGDYVLEDLLARSLGAVKLEWKGKRPFF